MGFVMIVCEPKEDETGSRIWCMIGCIVSIHLLHGHGEKFLRATGKM